MSTTDLDFDSPGMSQACAEEEELPRERLAFRSMDKAMTWIDEGWGGPRPVRLRAHT